MAANDPHLAYGIPGTWYLAHLQAPGLNVSGATLPGVPCVISGHNAQIAWGVTNLETDALDLYREQLDVSTGRYLFKGITEQAQLDGEIIQVRGGKPVQMNTWITRHGPVMFQEGNQSFTMRWTAAEGFGFPFFKINRAQNFEQFRSALGVFWGPAQNFIYADGNGNIGYQAAGKVPIRANFDGDVPLDGSSGEFEWDGYIPFEQMPNLYNPPSGIIATANQNPFPQDYAYRVSGSFADNYRVRQIRALLSAKSKLTVDDMLATQKDVYSAYDHFLAQQVISAYQKVGSKDEAVRDAVEVLRKWDGQMDKDDAAPVMTQLLSEAIGNYLTTVLTADAKRAEMAKAQAVATGKKAYAIVAVAPNIHPRPQVVENFLRGRPAGWVKDDNWDSWLLLNFEGAIQEGRDRLGSPASKWRWGQILKWKFDHPVGKQLPLVDSMFDLGPIEMSGSGTTVKQTTAAIGPSERMVVDFGDLDRSVQNLVVGESGFVASGHYKDQWPAYYVGKSFPMQFKQVEARETLRVKPGP